MRLFTVIILSGLFTFYACSKKKLDEKNKPPRDFEVAPVRSSPNGIFVRWAESTDPENSIIKYTIYVGVNQSGAEMKLVASNLSEVNSVHSDLEYVADIFGISARIPYPNNNPEYRFAYPIADLEENTAWEGKIVATDQDGYSTEKYFWSSTTDDSNPPQIYTFIMPVAGIKNTSATIYWERQDEARSEMFIYLDDVLISSVKAEDYKHYDLYNIGTVSYYMFTGLNPNTTYQCKLILKDRNGNASAPKIKTFTTVS